LRARAELVLTGPFVGVGCIVLREGKLLLVRDRRGNQPGTWSTPGGHLDPGEMPAACAARETLEETGVRISNVQFVGITNDIFESSGRHYVTIWMRGEPDASEAIVADAEEILEVGWFPPTDLPQPLFLSLVNLLAGRSLPAAPDAIFAAL
jgi:8-oxo-dGTP diphosphatase